MFFGRSVTKETWVNQDEKETNSNLIHTHTHTYSPLNLYPRIITKVLRDQDNTTVI